VNLKVTGAILTIALMSVLAACSNPAEKKENGEKPAPTLNSASTEKQGEIIGDYQYPENPSEQLRSALENDVNKRGLPMKIGVVENVEFDGKAYSQIEIEFIDGDENMCVITFFNKHLEYGYDESLDGRDNPSFTMAFKDPDNSRDMITLLTAVINYLSPDLSFAEAERLAANQDKTISTDGFAQPLDIGGYQIQAQYTNPHIFNHTTDFESKMGVKVTALKQIWHSAIDTGDCQELTTSEDFSLLDKEYPYWTETDEPICVYADFIVKNTWQEQSYLHGETWVVVDLESMDGQQYSLSLDTWEFPKGYEFGVGQQYTVFVRRYPRMGIVYAVQRSESARFQSRGTVQPIDYPTDDWRDPIRRIEPEGGDVVYDVSFSLQSQSYGERFAALEGHRVGEKQWPKNPSWEGYTFVGWYDNAEGAGSPFTPDTPVYHDTYLYAKWKYSGGGGAWPRARRGDIQGNEVSGGLSITASGYNMSLESPKDQRFRWLPIEWRLSDGASGGFSGKAPFQATLPLGGKDEQRLYVTYKEEVFDGVGWQETSRTREVEEGFALNVETNNP
jgi:uncharacterized repeat protein (TIGR02543 family)